MKRPSPALVLAFLALTVAISPHAVAAGKKLIGTKQIKKGAVTTKKIKKGAVTAGKLRDGAVSTSKLQDGAVTGPKLAPGVIPGPPDLSPFARTSDVYTRAEADQRFAPAAPGSRTVFVAGGGTPEENGQRLIDAWEGLPEDQAAIVVQLDAGNFDIGDYVLNSRAGLQLSGASRQSTNVMSDGTAISVDPGTGITVTDLTVLSEGANGIEADGFVYLDRAAVQVSNESGTVRGIDARDTSVIGRDCYIAASSQSGAAFGLDTSMTELHGCTVWATGTAPGTGIKIAQGAGAGYQIIDTIVNVGNGSNHGGVHIEAGGGRIMNSRIEAYGSGRAAIQLDSTAGGGLKVYNSQLTGNGGAAVLESAVAGNGFRVAHSMLDTSAGGDVVIGTGANDVQCIGAYDNFWNALVGDCEPL